MYVMYVIYTYMHIYVLQGLLFALSLVGLHFRCTVVMIVFQTVMLVNRARFHWAPFEAWVLSCGSECVHKSTNR